MIQSKLSRATHLPLLALCGAVIAACSQAESPKAPAEPAPAAAPAPVANQDWAKLASLTGQTPSESGLFDTSPISASLQSLLDDRFDVLKANFLIDEPLQAEQDVLYTVGHRLPDSRAERAYVLIHPETRALEVGLWEAGKLTTFKTQGASIPKPADIKTMISTPTP